MQTPNNNQQAEWQQMLAFVEGTLPEVEHEAVLARMEVDEAYAQAIEELMRASFEGDQWREQAEGLMAVMQSAPQNTEMPSAEGQVRRLHWGWWASMAAVISLLFAVYLADPVPVSYASLAQEAYQPYEPTAYSDSRAAEDSQEPIPYQAQLDQAYLRYQAAKDYPTAMSLLRDIPASSLSPTLAAETQLMIANCLYQLGDYQESQQLLQGAMSRIPVDYQAAYAWYLSLVSLQLDQPSIAEVHLPQVIASDLISKSQKETAQELLTQIQARE